MSILVVFCEYLQAAKRLTTYDAMHLMQLAKKSQQQSLDVELISPQRPDLSPDSVSPVVTLSKQVRILTSICHCKMCCKYPQSVWAD